MHHGAQVIAVPAHRVVGFFVHEGFSLTSGPPADVDTCLRLLHVKGAPHASNSHPVHFTYLNRSCGPRAGLFVDLDTAAPSSRVPTDMYRSRTPFPYNLTAYSPLAVPHVRQQQQQQTPSAAWAATTATARQPSATRTRNPDPNPQ